MISIKQLRYFHAVARFGHFGRAASHCSVTQPALSMQIKELENELSVKLLERRHHGVQLTEPGREVARRAAQVLTAVRDISDFAQHYGRSLSGPLHLGVIPSLAPYLLPPLLPLMREKCPALDLHIRETQTEPLVQQLVDGGLDLLLLALPIEHPEIETIRLFDDRFLLAMPHDWSVGNQVKATHDLIRHDRLLLLEEGHCLRDQALAFCQLRQIHSVDTFGASSLSTIAQMVANGLGLTLLPEVSIGVETKHSSIRLMRFAEPQPHRVVGLAWRSTSPRKRDFNEFGKLVLQSKPTDHVLAG